MKNKHDARKLPPKGQQDLRRRVVDAVVKQGMSKTEAAKTFQVGRTSVHNWVKAYEADGAKALRSRKRGPKHSSSISGYQAATIVRLIEDRCPDQLRLPFALWTRDAVSQLIAKRFDIHLSVWTVGRYLKRWGFTPQKPLRRAYERDPVAIAAWLKDEYPAIEKQAKAEKACISWGDEMGLRSDHQAGTTYGRKGRTPIIPGTGQRFGCNMISAITNRGHLTWMVFDERFTSKVFITFLGRLIKHHASGDSPRKVFLIVDGHPVHRSRQVKQWLLDHEQSIRLFYLPGYSPELNPDEYLNHDVKANAVGRRRPKDRSQMMSHVRSYLRSTQKQPRIVRNFFNHPDVRYAAGT